MRTEAEDVIVEPRVERARSECLSWCRDWMRWSAVAATLAAVVEVHAGRGRNDSDRLTIRLNAPSMMVSIDDPSRLDRYFEGQEAEIWYDPRNPNHVRTRWDSVSDANDDPAGIAAGAMALGAVLALYRLATAARLGWKLTRHAPTPSISRIGWKSAGKNTRTLFEIDGALFTVRRTVLAPEARWVCGRGRARTVFAFTQPHERHTYRCRPYLVRRSLVPFRERYWRNCRSVDWPRRPSKPKRWRTRRR
jgi:hypothetical protein